MSEPTIDELIKAFDALVEMAEGELGKGPPEEDRNYNAIRAILEQHEAVRTKLMLLETAAKFQECEAIRAFVERVKHRRKILIRNSHSPAEAEAAFENAFRDELAAMEAEVKE
jgi:hypothetical protein